jgi:hypothetical protein
MMHSPYSSVVERQSCQLKVLGSIPSEGSMLPREDSMLAVARKPCGFGVFLDGTRVFQTGGAFWTGKGFCLSER